jgi:hypothetical protein
MEPRQTPGTVERVIVAVITTLTCAMLAVGLFGAVAAQGS